MENQEKNGKEYYRIDVSHVVKSLWKRAWLIALCGFAAAVLGLLIAVLAVSPKYSSYVKLYVNNSASSSGSISSSELTAAQNLVKTYGDILISRSTLERVIEKTGVSYTWKELARMIEYEPSNGTEIMQVTVTCEDPYEAQAIADAIAHILPVRISEIVEGASMEVVDEAILDLEKVAPSNLQYTLLGFVLGVFVSVAALIVLALLDDRVHDEEYVLRNYDVPVLGKIPDLLKVGGHAYGYRRREYRADDVEERK